MPVNLYNDKKKMKRKVIIGALAALGGLGAVSAVKLAQQPVVHADTTNTPAVNVTPSTTAQNTDVTNTDASNEGTAQPQSQVQPQQVQDQNQVQDQQQQQSVTPITTNNATDNNATDTNVDAEAPAENTTVQSTSNADVNNENQQYTGSSSDYGNNTAQNESSVVSDSSANQQINNVPKNSVSSTNDSTKLQTNSDIGASTTNYRSDTSVLSSSSNNNIRLNSLHLSLGDLSGTSLSTNPLSGRKNNFRFMTNNHKINTNNLNHFSEEYLSKLSHPQVLPEAKSLQKAPSQPRVTPKITVAKVVPLKINGKLNVKHTPKMMLLGASASGLPSQAFINDLSDYPEGHDYDDAGGGPYPQIDLSTWSSPKGTMAFCNDYSLMGPHGGREYYARSGTAPMNMKQGLAYAIDSAKAGANGINNSNLRLVEELIIWETENANPRQRVHADHVHGAARTAAFLAQKAIRANYPYFGDVTPKVTFSPLKNKDTAHWLRYQVELKNGTNVHDTHVFLNNAPKGSQLYIHQSDHVQSGAHMMFYPNNPKDPKEGYGAFISIYNPKDNLLTDPSVDKLRLVVQGTTDGKIQVQDYATRGGGKYMQDATLMKVTPHNFRVSASAKGESVPTTVPETTPPRTVPGIITTPTETTPQTQAPKTTTNINTNNNTTTGGSSSTAGGSSSSSTGGSPSGNGNQQQGGNGNGTQGGGNGTQANGNGNNGGGNGSPANNPNNSNNPNNGQPNNANPNNDDANNVIVPSGDSDGGSTSNNNNIVPSGSVINNNDYIIPNNMNGAINDNKADSEIIAALINNENRDNQDALNRLDSNVQSEENAEIQRAKTDAINSANIVSAAERGKNAAQIDAMNASASIQSIEDSMDVDSRVASLSNQAQATNKNYMDSLNSLEAESNKLTSDTIARLQNMSNLPINQRNQAYIAIQQLENQFIRGSINGNTASDGAVTTLDAKLKHILANLHPIQSQASSYASNTSMKSMSMESSTSNYNQSTKSSASTMTAMPMIPQILYNRFPNMMYELLTPSTTVNNNTKITNTQSVDNKLNRNTSDLQDSDDAFYDENLKDERHTKYFKSKKSRNLIKPFLYNLYHSHQLALNNADMSNDSIYHQLSRNPRQIGYMNYSKIYRNNNSSYLPAFNNTVTSNGNYHMNSSSDHGKSLLHNELPKTGDDNNNLIGAILANLGLLGMSAIDLDKRKYRN